MSTGIKIRNSILLLLAAAIWGFAFSFQQMAGECMGPFTLNAARSFLGVLALIPVVKLIYGNLKPNRVTLIGGILCGIALSAACNLQQAGLIYTSPGKAGFITASYMVIVVLIGLFTKKKPGAVVMISVLLGVIGLFLICVPEDESLNINRGDLLCIACAFFFALQILIIDEAGEAAESVKMSAIQFTVVAAVSLILALIFEKPSVQNVKEGFLPLLYIGIMSTAVAYTLQMVGMNGLNPAVSSLIMSLESVFSVIGEFVILGTVLSGKALIGCCVMFAAIILSQFDTFKKALPASEVSPGAKPQISDKNENS